MGRMACRRCKRAQAVAISVLAWKGYGHGRTPAAPARRDHGMGKPRQAQKRCCGSSACSAARRQSSAKFSRRSQRWVFLVVTGGQPFGWCELLVGFHGMAARSRSHVAVNGPAPRAARPCVDVGPVSLPTSGRSRRARPRLDAPCHCPRAPHSLACTDSLHRAYRSPAP